MIKKLITLLVLVGLVYMGYRIVDPIGAQALVAKIQSRFVTDKAAPIVQVELEQESTPIVISTGIQANTGLIDTSAVAASEIIMQEEKPVSFITGSIIPTKPSINPPVQSQPGSTSKSSSSLSDQDMKDLQRFLNAIVE